MGESDYSVRTDLLQSGALGNSFSGGYPSLNSDKPGAFQGLASAESKDTLQKGNAQWKETIVNRQYKYFPLP